MTVSSFLIQTLVSISDEIGISSQWQKLLEYEAKGKFEDMNQLLDEIEIDNNLKHDLAIYLQSSYNTRRSNYDKTINLISEHQFSNEIIRLHTQIYLVWSLIYKGDYDDAKYLAHKLSELSVHHDFDHISHWFSYLIGLINHDLGNFDLSTKYFETVDEDSTDKYLRSITKTSYADVLVHTGDYMDAKTYFDEASKIAKQLDDPFPLFYYHHIVGIYYYFTVKPEKARNQFNQALKLAEQMENGHFIARVYYSLGELEFNTGDFVKAKRYLNDSIDLFDQINNERDLSFPHMILSLIMSEEQEFDQALDHIDTSISLLANVGNKQDLSSCFQIKGEILTKMGKFNEGIENLKQSLETKKEIQNDTLTAIALFQLILTYNEIGDNSMVGKYEDEIKKLHQQSDLEYVEHVYKAVKAYNLKQNNRLKDKVASMEIFEDLYDKIKDYNLKVFITLNLCDLLLEELKLFEQDEIIDIIRDYLSEINQLASHNDDNWLSVESRILEIRFKIIQGKIREGHSGLMELEQFVRSLGNERLLNKVISEKRRFEDTIDSWMLRIESGTNIYEMLQESEIEEYLKEISENFKFDKH